jgi:hypothetical protein
MTADKLTPAQLTLLRQIRKRGLPVAQGYRPAKVLTGLGLAKWSKGLREGAYFLSITQAGEACYNRRGALTGEG